MKKEIKDIKEKDIYIFGHMNPDTDSICSTLAYANLKEKLGYKNIHPCRLGNLNKESTFVLDFLNVEAPELFESVKPTISDLSYYDTEVLYATQDIKDAREKLKIGGTRMIPIINESRELKGIVSNTDIMKWFDEFHKSEKIQSEIIVSNLIRNLTPTEVKGSYEWDKIKGNIYIDSTAIGKEINKNDIVISTNCNLTRSILEEYKEFVLIVPESSDLCDVYEYCTKETMLIKSPHSLLNTIHIIAQSVSVSSIMTKDDIDYFATDEYIDDIKKTVIESPVSQFPIVGKDNKVEGVLSRRHLLSYERKNVILIDHNEATQSIKGIKEAEVLEIVDHHRIDGVATNVPPMIRIEPVGCTSTVVYKLYCENGIEIDKTSASLMLSAILSDTLILKSPTCTPEDVRVAKELSKISGLNIDEYGKEMLGSSLNVADDEWGSYIRSDIKRFNIGSYDMLISNVNIANYKNMMGLKDKIKDEMSKICKQDKCETFILMLTDIIEGGSWMICIGRDNKLFHEAFGIKYEDDNIFIPGLLSRKKQVLPKVIAAIEKL